MKCSDGCGYYYYDEIDGYETCHYPDTEPHQWAPCELAAEDERREREEEYYRRQIEIESEYD